MSDAMSSDAMPVLLKLLDLETLEVNLFRGYSPPTLWRRVFGGQVVGQALVAASRTVEGIALRSEPLLTIQYHSEACPGPLDSMGIFDRFITMMAAIPGGVR